MYLMLNGDRNIKEPIKQLQVKLIWRLCNKEGMNYFWNEEGWLNWLPFERPIACKRINRCKLLHENTNLCCFSSPCPKNIFQHLVCIEQVHRTGPSLSYRQKFFYRIGLRNLNPKWNIFESHWLFRLKILPVNIWRSSTEKKTSVCT